MVHSNVKSLFPDFINDLHSLTLALHEVFFVFRHYSSLLVTLYDAMSINCSVIRINFHVNDLLQPLKRQTV